MARRRDHVDSSITQIDLGKTVRLIREIVVAPNAVNIESNHLNIGGVRELSIARAMVGADGMDHKQGSFAAASPGSKCNTVSASGIWLGSATSPVMRSAFVDPIRTYMNGASKVAQRFSRRMNVRALY